MKSTLRVAGGLGLVLVLLAGLSAVGVSAQGPTGTATPTTVPAQAPSAPGRNLDDPAAANAIGSNIASIAANTAQWYRFDYGTNGNAIPRPMVTIRLVNGARNGLNFEVWSPERLQDQWWNNKPVGRGNPEYIPSCQITLPDNTTQRCTTNDLTWLGGFGTSGTYYIRIVNSTNQAVTPQLVITGSGLAQCQAPAQGQNQAQAQGTNQGSFVQCQDLTPDQIKNLGQNQSTTGNQNPNQSTAPNQSNATSTPAATSAPNSAPTATTAATAAPSATTASPAPSTTATSAPSGSAPGAQTPAAAPAIGASGKSSVTALTTANNPAIGPILTDSQGFSLYAFVKDANNTSNCNGNCAQTWPPALASAMPSTGSGIDAAKLGTLTRSDGSTQLTYNGHPLYYYSGDKLPTDTNGQAFAGNWYTLSPSGNLNQNLGGSGTGSPAASPTP